MVYILERRDSKGWVCIDGGFVLLLELGFFPIDRLIELLVFLTFHL
jgi:hypothetical protein